MQANEQTIRDFYTAFNQKDYQKMAEAYHPEATFKDEAFDLKGKEIGAMWQMLCEAASQDFKVQCTSVKSEGIKVFAAWEAWYTFSRTGKKVHNIIKAEFEFGAGKIIRHRDSFNFWRWASMAFGMTGLLLGWTGYFKNKVRETVKRNLKKFMEAS